MNLMKYVAGIYNSQKCDGYVIVDNDGHTIVSFVACMNYESCTASQIYQMNICKIKKEEIKDSGPGNRILYITLNDF